MEGPFELSYEPATQWKYSNLGFSLLGRVVAAESGEPWDAYVEKHILEPLGMKSSRPLPRLDEPGLAIGYTRVEPGGALVPADKMPNGPVAPAGALASSVDDLAKYLAFHMAEGASGDSPVLSGRTLREMHRPQWLLADWQNAWGLGMAIRHVDGYVRVGHGGSVPGQRTNIQFYPALKLGVIVLTNSDEIDPLSYVEYAFQVLAPVVAKSESHAKPPLGEEARRFVGTYRGKNHATQIVAILDGQLSLLGPEDLNPYATRTILEATDQPRVFMMRSGGAFSALQFGEKMTFDVSADGTVTGCHTSSARFTRVGPP
jgi:CubicO group peptidase (beta-lactamase class C family)